MFVEFDSNRDSWDYENLRGHVGINFNSVRSAIISSWNASEHSGEIADVWIVYDSKTNNLTVSWLYKLEPRSSLYYEIDLMTIVDEWVSIGFSATASGTNKERHILKSWEFSSNLEEKLPTEPATPPTNPPEGSNDKPPEGSSDKPKLALFVGLGGLGVLVMMGIILLFFYQKRRKSAKAKKEEAIYDRQLERGAGPRRFSYAELNSATHNFSESRKLGEGGFGAVYKGYLIELDLPIAAKRTYQGSKNVDKQYIIEVTVISKLKHKNLVQLVGWCHGKGDYILVYEYMPNGSLDAHLFGDKPPLPWSIRYKVALGLAAGLVYLHEECEQCVVHRDIKPSNIMLDASFNVKLGDFGLATLMEPGMIAQTTTLAGTLGYMAPEYISTGKASMESDVYSFGVVVLEIATGKTAAQQMSLGAQNGLVKWIWELYGRNELTSAADDKMENEYDTKQIECLMSVGLWCAHPDHKMRPSIRQAIQVLNFEATLPSLPPKMPVPIYEVFTPSTSVTSGDTSRSFAATSVQYGR